MLLLLIYNKKKCNAHWKQISRRYLTFLEKNKESYIDPSVYEILLFRMGHTLRWNDEELMQRRQSVLSFIHTNYNKITKPNLKWCMPTWSKLFPSVAHFHTDKNAACPQMWLHIFLTSPSWYSSSPFNWPGSFNSMMQCAIHSSIQCSYITLITFVPVMLWTLTDYNTQWYMYFHFL
jgi:hypothetical protein